MNNVLKAHNDQLAALVDTQRTILFSLQTHDDQMAVQCDILITTIDKDLFMRLGELMQA